MCLLSASVRVDVCVCALYGCWLRLSDLTIHFPCDRIAKRLSKMMLSPLRYRCRPKTVSIAVIAFRGPIVFPIVRTSPIPNRPNVLLSLWHVPTQPMCQPRSHSSRRSILWWLSVRSPLHDDLSTGNSGMELANVTSVRPKSMRKTHLKCALLDWWTRSAIICHGRIESIGEIDACATSERVDGVIEIGVRTDVRRFSVCTKTAQRWSYLCEKQTHTHTKSRLFSVKSGERTFALALTFSSNSSMAAPIVLFGTRAPRTSKNASSVMARSARRLAFSMGSSKIGSAAKSVGRAGDWKRSDESGLFSN